MSVDGSMPVADLLRLCPWAEEVLDRYGLDTRETAPDLTLDTLCLVGGVDRDGVLRELDTTSAWREAAIVPAPDEAWELGG